MLLPILFLKTLIYNPHSFFLDETLVLKGGGVIFDNGTFS